MCIAWKTKIVKISVKTLFPSKCNNRIFVKTSKSTPNTTTTTTTATRKTCRKVTN